MTRAALRSAALVVALATHPGLGSAQDTTGVEVEPAIAEDSLPPTVAVAPLSVGPLAPQQPLPPDLPDGPLAPGARYVFTRDSITWSPAITLADLLAEVPGVYVARIGVFGQPEYVQYGGRGGSALEIYWDGLRLTPLGTDSLFLDPTLISLRYVRRVDIEVLPGALRVHMASERHGAGVPRSVIRVMAGAFNAAGYSALFQSRSTAGVSLDIAADFQGTDGASGVGRSDQRFDVWGRVGWRPSDRVEASYQVRRIRIDRDPAQTGTPQLAGVRAEQRFQIAASSAPDGRGLRLETGVLVSSWLPDSGAPEGDLRERRFFSRVGFHRPDMVATALLEFGDRWTPFSAEARAGWVPVPGIVVSGDARVARHDGNRVSRWLHGSFGLYRGPFSLAGEIATARAVQAPALRADTAVRTVDRAVRFGVNLGPLLGSTALVQRDAYAPLPYPDLVAVSGFAPSERTTYFVSDVTLGPMAGFLVSGWYSNPIRGNPAGLQPPKHGRFALIYRSKFWRTFRSGAFDLQVRVAFESWSTGTAGLASDGQPIVLPGATFLEYHIAFQIVGFTAFWDLRNARLADAAFVPGFPYPKNVQTFGVIWNFAN